MAIQKYKGIGIRGVNEPLTQATLDPLGVMTSPVNKAWRSLILLHRALHSPNDDANKRTDPAKVNGNIKIKKEFREQEIKEGRTIVNKYGTFYLLGELDKGKAELPDMRVHDAYINLKNKPQNKNQVIIYNLNTSPYSYIILQNRPSTLDFKGETAWASIKSMGRNTPMYHYTGAEDTLQFNVSWYCSDPNHPDEVINKCRLLEAWSKANGYKASPPVLRIQWGSLKPSLFEGQLYILISATYTLKNFNDCVREQRNGSTLKITNHGLFPLAATQELIFRRVSAKNLNYEDILPESKIEYTRGINKQ